MSSPVGGSIVAHSLEPQGCVPISPADFKSQIIFESLQEPDYIGGFLTFLFNIFKYPEQIKALSNLRKKTALQNRFFVLLLS